MVTFVEMSAAEAKAFLEQFLAHGPERLDALRRRLVADGAAREDELDLSAASLEPVWAWAVPRLSWRAGYEPPPLGMPGPRGPAGELEPADELPEWFDARYHDAWRFSAKTLWVVDGVARYLAECLVAAVPGARWVVGRSRSKGYVYQNHPVVTGLPLDDVEPVALVLVAAGKALDGRPSSLRDLFEIHSGRRRP
ncbi:hypothetical protein [Cellulomonas carbonis]|uniref:Uncharacterized protein n=1 Tax=Cellulomonas carbonis T26 TaxID=947969 RepID=A0A0A0BWB8_9CELL|nr:hypothetical protein [Cellulomonas carbonis]KGM12683.1 hypothetical protein N868_06930 [Cellulomonas carbonis T26]GGC05858.1 hypothetical protein GCM10010972_18820 [Cellulomonas carbonis]